MGGFESTITSLFGICFASPPKLDGPASSILQGCLGEGNQMQNVASSYWMENENCEAASLSLDLWKSPWTANLLPTQTMHYVRNRF